MKSTDYKKMKIDQFAVTRNPNDFDKRTGNIYETVAILSKRANQIELDLKDEFNEKSQEFNSMTDTLEEVFENREQIELARYFEQLPKPTLLAIHEFENQQIYYKEPENPGMNNVGKK